MGLDYEDFGNCQAKIGGAEMTIILSDDNSQILAGPLVRPPGGWRGGNFPKLLSLYFLGKSDDNKNAIFQNVVFPVVWADNKISTWVPY